MKYSLLIFPLLIVVVCSCISHQNEKGELSIVCLRESDTLYLRIKNSSKDTIYIPEEYTGTYNVDVDTTFLETLDKVKYSTNYYYRYRNVFPFDFYSSKVLEGFKYDSVVQIVDQTYFFNQFMKPSLIPLYPDSAYFKRVVFHIPQNSNFIKAVYYRKTFNYSLQRDSVDRLFLKFLEFDSLYSKYAIAPLINRYHL